MKEKAILATSKYDGPLELWFPYWEAAPGHCTVYSFHEGHCPAGIDALHDVAVPYNKDQVTEELLEKVQGYANQCSYFLGEEVLIELVDAAYLEDQDDAHIYHTITGTNLHATVLS